jgi:hypothetical protein
MVIGDELEVRHKGTEAVPTRERLRTDHKAGEVPIRSNEWINFLGELLEVRFLKRSIGGYDKDVSVAQQFKANHGVLLLSGGRAT